jgi:hypothetical protein
VNPSLGPADVEDLLYRSALDLGAPGRDIQYGWGRVNAAAAVQAAAGAVSSVDLQAPTVSITAPVGSSSVAGVVAVDVAATDNKGVTRIDLLVNGKVVASDSTAPFAFSWDSTKVTNGMVELKAVALDAAGNAGTSAPVPVNVANAVVGDTIAPTVNINNPVNGSKVSGKVSIKVSASDNLGVAGIKQELYINGAKVASSLGGSLSYGWDTRKVKAGSYTLQAVARDAAGNTSTHAITVTR